MELRVEEGNDKSGCRWGGPKQLSSLLGFVYASSLNATFIQTEPSVRNHLLIPLQTSKRPVKYVWRCYRQPLWSLYLVKGLIDSSVLQLNDTETCRSHAWILRLPWCLFKWVSGVNKYHDMRTEEATLLTLLRIWCTAGWKDKCILLELHTGEPTEGCHMSRWILLLEHIQVFRNTKPINVVETWRIRR